MRLPHLLAALLGLLASALGACREPAPPTWLPLAAGFRPTELEALARRWEGEASRLESEIALEQQGVVVRHRLTLAQGEPEADGSLRFALGGAFARAAGARLESHPPLDWRARTTAGTLAPGEYRLAQGALELRAPELVTTLATPPLLRLSARLENGRAVDEGWQVRLGGHCGLGLPLFGGEREELATPLPAESALHFRFALADADGARAVRLVLTLDGASLLDERLTLARDEVRAFTVALPPEGRAAARLAFALEDTQALGVVFTPLVAPREPGTPAARPWGTPRPDVVLVLVDTLRADMLAPYGGAPELAPALNAFAERARVFTHARSNAAWTLPSVATLLTGVHPGLHGAVEENLSLARELPTFVEALARAGYRTGAVTDANFVSPIHGLEQGFEWFSEHYPPAWERWEEREPSSWNLTRTLDEARAFLAADDGRPTFLLVHTYRVHEPYRIGAEEDPRANRALLARAAEIAGTDEPPPDVGRRIMLGLMPELRAQYEEGVKDLDQKLGPFLQELEAADFFARGHLFLTSDHGEALGENQDFGHGNHLWEVKLRVPLLWRGPRITPARVPHVATLLDLAPTVAALTGLAREPAWPGRALDTLDGERPAFAWQLGAKSRQVAWREGTRKIITTPEAEALRAGQCAEAFELATDPGETENLARSVPWPAELTRARAEEILAALVGPRGPAIPLSRERQKELEELGYGGDNDEPPSPPEKPAGTQ